MGRVPTRIRTFCTPLRSQCRRHGLRGALTHRTRGRRASPDQKPAGEWVVWLGDERSASRVVGMSSDLDRDDTVHVGVTAGLEHQQLAKMIEVLARIAALVEDRGADDLGVPRLDNANRFASCVHLGRCDGIRLRRDHPWIVAIGPGQPQALETSRPGSLAAAGGTDGFQNRSDTCRGHT